MQIADVTFKLVEVQLSAKEPNINFSTIDSGNLLKTRRRHEPRARTAFWLVAADRAPALYSTRFSWAGWLLHVFKADLGKSKLQFAEDEFNFNFPEMVVGHRYKTRHCQALTARTALHCVKARRVLSACSTRISWVWCFAQLLEATFGKVEVQLSEKTLTISSFKFRPAFLHTLLSR